MLKERRHSTRVKCEIEAEIYSNIGEKYIGKGVVKNISVGGVGLLLDDSLLIHGEGVVLKFVLEKKKEVTVSGEVVYVKNEDEKFYYGIRLKGIDLLRKELLRKYIVAKTKEIKYTL